MRCSPDPSGVIVRLVDRQGVSKYAFCVSSKELVTGIVFHPFGPRTISFRFLRHGTTLNLRYILTDQVCLGHIETLCTLTIHTITPKGSTDTTPVVLDRSPSFFLYKLESSLPPVPASDFFLWKALVTWRSRVWSGSGNVSLCILTD